MKNFASYLRLRRVMGLLLLVGSCSLTANLTAQQQKTLELLQGLKGKDLQDADTIKAADFIDALKEQRAALAEEKEKLALEKQKHEEVMKGVLSGKALVDEDLVKAKKALEEAEKKQAEQEKKMTEFTTKLEASEKFNSLPAEEKLKIVMAELAKNKALEYTTKSAKSLEAFLKRQGIDVPPELKAKLKEAADKKGSFMGLDSDSLKGATFARGAAVLGGLAGLGGVGAGGTLVASDLLDEDGNPIPAAGGIAGTTTTKLVDPGITLDLSKLTIPTLQPLIENGSLKAVMYASRPISILSDQLLKAITTTVIIKVQESFNMVFTGMKSARSEFNEDGAIEQITAKTLQDCKEIKGFAVNLLDLVGETKRKTTNLEGVAKTVGMIINQVKKNYETLFTVEIVAQLTVAQQKVAKPDLLNFMKRVNKTVQLALDDASKDVTKKIKDRMAKVVGSGETPAQPEEEEVKEVVKVKSTKPVAVKTLPVEPVATGWDALVNQ